ncbi:serine/threonine-protein kinase [Aldersonia kunmingensis]|uniref:serine/threonine-protein kinase n=1 Tax=Aldersonia kunmingensis TaxID=408066 RepID=UPI00082E65AA|nr:serine/threonine-protein kinase [Aldersonia kunmingensis]
MTAGGAAPGSKRTRSYDDPVASFARAWADADTPPDLHEFLPPGPGATEALIDLIRVDLQHRWLQAGTRKRLADYCAEFSDLEPSTLPADLVYEEFVIRRHSGERIDPDAYLREYPAQATELAKLLNVEEPDPSTRRVDVDGTATMNMAMDGTATMAVDGADATDQTVTRAMGGAATAALGGAATMAANPTLAPSADLTRTATRAGGVLSEPDIEHPLESVDVGQSVDDFDLLTVLGAGAFARVFLARQRSMQRLVAVKVSADHGTEPQTLARLDHDYIVRVFDQRVLPERRLRLLYMQFLPGGTLLGALRWVRATPPEQRNGQLLLDAVDAAMEEKGEIRPSDSSVRAEIAGLSWPETVAWLGRRLAEALEYAGRHGVLHRDVKPANILLTSEGVPKLADFNISYSRTVAGTSPVAYFGGSLSYMSPEQLAACHTDRADTPADLDTRSDIFALGVVLWELLTGNKPFGDDGAAGSDDTVIDAMLANRADGIGPAALSQLPEDCPAALSRVLTTALAPNPDDRWASAAELAQQFELCLDARARDLVDPPPGSWRLKLRPYVFPIVALAIGVPNALASVYNIYHNQTLIISKLSEDAQSEFQTVTAFVNVLLFPLAGALMVYVARRVISVPRGLRKGRVYDEQTLAQARSDTLLATDRIVWIAFGAWILAGLTFPISLQLVPGDVPAGAYLHIFGSLVVCGAIAVAYPFFLVTFFLVRSVYPIFLQQSKPTETDALQLRGLDRRSNFYLAVAASVPLLGVAGVTFIAPDDIPSVIVAVRVLCVLGILAFVGAYRLFRMLEEDLRALERVVAGGR